MIFKRLPCHIEVSKPPYPRIENISFRVWTHFDLSNVTKAEIENLKKFAPALENPLDQLRAQIVNFRHINPEID